MTQLEYELIVKCLEKEVPTVAYELINSLNALITATKSTVNENNKKEE